MRGAASVTPLRPGRVLGGSAVLVALVLAGCDSGAAPGPRPTSGASTTAAPGSTSPPPGSTAPSTLPTGDPTGSATVTGPATPAASPGTFTIVVTGAGEVAYPVTGVACSGATVTGTATPTDGGTSGTLSLDAGTGVLTVSGLPPLDGTRLTGTTSGTPAAGATVDWTGDGTGAAASWQLTCP